MEKKFNIGDRVRFTRDYDNECVCVDKGDCGTIERIDANGILITLDNPEYVRIFDTDYIEPITPIDPKTAFLLELKGLLEKYNASIYVDFNQSDEIYTTTIAVGEDSVKYNSTDGIDCDNIMDYEKE